jgi:hypothetical protein
MTEGTVPVPPDRPCAEYDDDVLPAGGIAFEGCHSSGDEIQVSFQFVIAHFSRVKKSIIF